RLGVGDELQTVGLRPRAGDEKASLGRAPRVLAHAADLDVGNAGKRKLRIKVPQQRVKLHYRILPRPDLHPSAKVIPRFRAQDGANLAYGTARGNRGSHAATPMVIFDRAEMV